MMKYITILLLLVFFGCKTPLKVTDSREIKVTDKTRVAIAETRESKSTVEVNASKTTEAGENVVTATKVTEYDTDKPVNPNTGKPPVKSETETSQTINRGKKTQEETSTAAGDTTSYEKTDNSKKDIRTEAKRDHSERKQLPTIFWRALSILIVAIVVWVFRGKIKALFKKIF